VHFDEHVTGLESLQRVVEECYHHCRGERSLGHVCPSPAAGDAMPSSEPVRGGSITSSARSRLLRPGPERRENVSALD
jgi:hypothetical protein